jgi:hypothetical protein
MNNQTPPPPAGYPQAYAPDQPYPGAFNAPPSSPPPPAPGYTGGGTHPAGHAPPPANPPPPPYKPFPNDPTLIFQLIDRDKISASTEVCHRHAIDPKRVASIAKRCKSGAHFPPLVLFQQADGTLLPVDGLHRLAAFDQIGIKIISAIVIDDLAEALVAGIRQNLPKDGKVRSGADAVRSLCLLATALGRKITQPEAASLGLRFDENHEVLSPTTRSLMAPPFPSFSAIAPDGANSEKAGRKRAIKPKKKAA